MGLQAGSFRFYESQEENQGVTWDYTSLNKQARCLGAYTQVFCFASKRGVLRPFLHKPRAGGNSADYIDTQHKTALTSLSQSGSRLIFGTTKCPDLPGATDAADLQEEYLFSYPLKNEKHKARISYP